MVSSKKPAPAPAQYPGAEMLKHLKASPAGPYGFIVSQQVYDSLRAQVPEAFDSGNSFAAVPIVVDPDLSPADCDVAFTRKGWNDRLRSIRNPRR